MWIIKTVFIGSDGKTTEISEVKTEDEVKIRREEQIQNWYNVLVDAVYEVEDKLPNRLHAIFLNNINRDRFNFMLDMINFTIKMKNKYENPLVMNSFTIDVYEKD